MFIALQQLCSIFRRSALNKVLKADTNQFSDLQVDSITTHQNSTRRRLYTKEDVKRINNTVNFFA